MATKKDERADPWPRDENREIVHAPLTESDKEKIHAGRYTYIFEEEYIEDKRPDLNDFYPVFDEFHEKPFWAFPELKIKHYTVFQRPENPPYDKWIEHSHLQESILNKYFTETLAFYPMEKEDGLKFEKCNLVLSDETFSRIEQLTKDFKIEQHFDFILYLISAIQHMYLDEIQYCESPEEAKRIKNFPKQTQSLIEVLSQTERKHDWDWKKNGVPPQLNEILFRFRNSKPKFYTITDHHYVSYITDAIKEHFSKNIHKNWKPYLEAFPNIYSENEKNRQYRYRISKALHNYFIGENIFSLTIKNKPTDQEVRCIARILEFAHIRSTDKKGNVLSSYDDPDVIKIVKHWIERKEKIQPKERILEAADKTDLLYKYFDKALIDSVNSVYDTNDLGFVWTICSRFDIQYLMPELARLFKILRCFSYSPATLFQAFEAETNPKVNDEFFQFVKLINSLKQDSRSTAGIKFIQKDNTEVNISSSLLLDLVGKALPEYYQNNPADFKVDLLKRVDDKNVLKEPHERFLPQFCLAFHNFLKKEVKLTGNDISPTKNFYTIIGLLIQHAWLFTHMRHDEYYLREKVGEWIETAKAAHTVTA